MGRKHEMSDNQVTVTTLNGDSLAVSGYRHMRVADLKRKVQSELNIPRHVQSIVLQGQQLGDAFELPAGKVEVFLVLIKHHEDFLRWLNIVRRHPESLANAPDDVRNDRHFFLEHLKCSTQISVLDFAAKEVLADFEVIRSAVCCNSLALRYASPALNNYKQLVLCAISSFCKVTEVLPLAAPQMRFCEDVALKAVSKDGLALGYFSEDLRANFKIVLVAVKSNGLALQHASSPLQADLKVVSTACARCAQALNYADPSMRNKPDLFSHIVKRNGCTLEFASVEIRGDPKLVSLAVKRDAVALTHAADSLQNNSQFVLGLLGTNGRALAYVRPDVFSTDMIDAAMAWALQWVSAGKSWHMVPECLRCHRELIEAKLNKSKTGTYSTLQLAETLGDRELVLAHIKKNPQLLEHANAETTMDAGIVLEAVKQDGMLLRHARGRTVENTGVALAAVSQNGLALELVSNELRQDYCIVHAALLNNLWARKFALGKVGHKAMFDILASDDREPESETFQGEKDGTLQQDHDDERKCKRKRTKYSKAGRQTPQR